MPRAGPDRHRGQACGAANALQDLGALFLWTGRHDQAREYLDRSTATWRRTGFRRGEATSSGGLGIVFWHQGRYELSRESFERSLSLSREIGYRQGEAIAEGNLAQLSIEEGRLDEAEGRLGVCADLSQALRQRHVEIYVALYSGHLARAQERPSLARAAYEQAVGLSREIKARPGPGDH